MSLFHKNINEKLSQHIFELERIGTLTSDWYWDSQRVYELERIDKELIKDLLGLYKSKKKDRVKFQQILQKLSLFQRILRKFMKESKANAGDRRFVILINKFVKEIERLLDNFPLRIGVTGYITQKFDEQQALKYLRKAFDKIEKKYPRRNKEVVGKHIDAGIYAIAYREASRRKWKTIGIPFSEFQGYSLFPVNGVIQLSGTNEYYIFISTIDVLVRVGGLYLARNECDYARSENKEVYEYNVKAELKTIADMEPIHRSDEQIIKSRNEVKRFVELPLLKASRILYDKNIRTLRSSANIKDIGGTAQIVIDYSSLSDKNKRIAESVCRIFTYPDSSKTATIEIPLQHKDVPISYIERQSVDIVNKFERQRKNR